MKMISPYVNCRGRGSVPTTTGLPQGNGLSPLLSNIHLHQFDLACAFLVYFRYADDILVLGRTRQEIWEAKYFLKRQLARLGLQLNEEKTIIRNVYREPVVFLGYELRGGNIYPPQKAVLRLEKGLQFRGQDARLNLMRGFVRRYQIGHVRKLFRRLDRDLRQLFPPGITLVGLLDNAKAKATAGGRNIPTGRARKLRHSRARDEGLPRV